MHALPHSPLTALSPLDGRYARASDALRPLFSEFGLIRQRVRVELAWLEWLSAEPWLTELPPFSAPSAARLGAIATDFSLADAEAVKAIEARTNHDVKAVEYWLADALADLPEGARARPFIHFACTSEDINNLAYALMLADARRKVLSPAIAALDRSLTALAHEHAGLAMLSRTHGQTATPTTLGKEMANIAHRLRRAHHRLEQAPIEGKFNGAVGNYNAHQAACPDADWPEICRRFVESLGLRFNPYTIQIEPHDGMAELFDALAAVNTVLLDASRDIWLYVSQGYFRQVLKAGEVGSSTMPHKVNPIDFENAEGNLGLANALLRHLADKLPVSRLQRDLSDSTVLRNIGVALGYGLLAYQSMLRGLDKLTPDRERLAADLGAAWEVLAEPVQTVMRRHGIADAYEQLKAITRGRGIDRAALHTFIAGLAIPEADKARLMALTPATYLGAAPRLANEI
ncbi:MAG: adenylosuccinate lyase [Betaproteobacteria bacterium]|nr:Adenylosuccinate lyase [Rhodocyclaceae bacterium]